MSKHGIEPTRWWWIRHAPVPNPDKVIYAQQDWDCDCSDVESFEVLARVLPRNALWVTSHLKRAKQTAAAIVKAGLDAPAPLEIPDFAEQSFGDWEGRTWDEFHQAEDPAAEAFWQDPARNAPPGGESFAQQMGRTAAAVERLTVEHRGRDIVAVTHGGTIRAALAQALDLTPEKGLALEVGNLSLTRLDHFEGGSLRGRGSAWRVVYVNQRPVVTL